MADSDDYEIPVAKRCFGCGTENEQGLGLKPRREAGAVWAVYHPKPHHRGFSRALHGGLVAALFDEITCMAAATEVMALVATVELTVRYLKPVPMDQPLRIEARDVGPHPDDPRRRRAEGKLTDLAGQVLATAQGVYQKIPPDRLKQFFKEADTL
ncbi:MAG TPA: PaaI family thioesterase [Myxococcales bacterium]|nr:PaaI family thioesterase [Myxococcales bacterium]